MSRVQSVLPAADQKAGPGMDPSVLVSPKASMRCEPDAALEGVVHPDQGSRNARGGVRPDGDHAPLAAVPRDPRPGTGSGSGLDAADDRQERPVNAHAAGLIRGGEGPGVERNRRTPGSTIRTEPDSRP